MTSFIPAQNVKFNKRLTAILQRSDEVALKFADNTTVRASVLVGADGIKSLVREHVLQPLYPSEVAPVYADAYCYRAVIPMEDAHEILGDLTDTAKFYFGRDRSAVSYRISGGKVSECPAKLSLYYLIPCDLQEFNYLLCVADPEPWKLDNAVTEKVSHETMMADFEGKGVDERLRRLLSAAEPIKWGFFHVRLMGRREITAAWNARGI